MRRHYFFRKALANEGFREEDHPRAEDGRFGDKPGQHGGGSKPGSKKPLAASEIKPGRTVEMPETEQLIGGRFVVSSVDESSGEVYGRRTDEAESESYYIGNVGEFYAAGAAPEAASKPEPAEPPPSPPEEIKPKPEKPQQAAPKAPTAAAPGPPPVLGSEAVSEAVRRAIKERPSRATHGDTGNNAFLVAPDGRIYAWDDKARRSVKNGHMIHSHSSEAGGADEDFNPHNGDDLDILRKGIAQGDKAASTVIMADGRMETISIDPDAEPGKLRAFLKLTKAKINRQTHLTYEEAAAGWRERRQKRAEQERERVRDFCARYGLKYEISDWKAPAAGPKHYRFRGAAAT